MNDFQRQLLEGHNEHRKEHGARELVWSDELAQQSQIWADKLAAEGKLYHANAEERSGNGESLALGANGDYTGRDATEQWYGEIKNFDQNSCSEFNPKTGHFTQLIWRSTTHVGAGIATDANGKHYVCARYNPAGNLKGSFQHNLLDSGASDSESVGGTIKQNIDQNENVLEIKAKEKFKRNVELGTVQHKATLSIDGEEEDIHMCYLYEEINTKPENDKIWKTVEVSSSHIPKSKLPEYYLRKDKYLNHGKFYQVTHYLIY